MGQTGHYFVRVTRRGQSKGGFGWEICRQHDSLVVDRSTKTYPTRAQALIASAKSARLMAFPLDVDPSKLRAPTREAGESQTAVPDKPPKASAKGR